MLRSGTTLIYRSERGHEGVTEPKDDADELDEETSDEDTSEDEADADDEETPDDAEQPDDWKARYAEQQKVLSRQGAELAIWRRGDAPEGRDRAAAEPEGGDEADDSGYVATLEADSWRAAEATYGEGAIDAYTAAYEIFERAQTPADYIAAFEAYHEIRSNGGTPEDAAAGAAGEGKKRTRAEATQPRVDLNQSDAGPDLNADKAVAEARKSGDLKGFVAASVRAMGFGGETRR